MHTWTNTPLALLKQKEANEWVYILHKHLIHNKKKIVSAKSHAGYSAKHHITQICQLLKPTIQISLSTVFGYWHWKGKRLTFGPWVSLRTMRQLIDGDYERGI